MAKRRGREFWQRLFDEYERRPKGLTQAEFARKHGVNLGTLQSWLYRLRRDQKAMARVESTPRFIEIEAPVAPLVRVRVGAVCVDFETLPPPAWVAELASLGGRSC